MNVYVHQFDGAATINALPLAAGLLVATARQDAALRATCELSIRVDRLPPQQVVASYARPRVLAYSAYAWNLRYSLAVAAQAKRAFPEALVVFGGPSIPREPERARAFLAAHAAVDVLAFGEGELVFRDLLRAVAFGFSLRTVRGIALRDGDRLTVTPRRQRLSDFSATASPFLDGTFAALMSANPFRFAAAVLETNRGCPFSCTFCDWGQATRSRVHELPLERVRAELDWVADQGLTWIYIVDANFGIRPRDLDIVKHLAAAKRRTGHPAFCYFHLTKNAKAKNLATVRTLRAADINCQIALSVQDFDPDVLAAIDRRNIRPQRALELRRMCNDEGIPTFNELILGLPRQTYDSFCDSVVQAVTPYPGDTFYVYLCRLLENTALATDEHRARFGLQTSWCPGVDSHLVPRPEYVTELDEVVIGSSTLSQRDWRRAFRFGQLLSALHNLRLLDVALQVLWRGIGVGLRAVVEGLLAAIEKAPRDSVLGELDAVLDRYADSIVAGGPLVLPRPDTDAHVWAVTDQIAIIALTRREAFFDELQSAMLATMPELAASPQLIRELFAYQELLTPGFDRPDPVERSFDFDWVALHQALGTRRIAVPERRRTRLQHSPPDYVARASSQHELLSSYVAVTYAKSEGAPRVVRVTDSRQLEQEVA